MKGARVPWRGECEGEAWVSAEGRLNVAKVMSSVLCGVLEAFLECHVRAIVPRRELSFSLMVGCCKGVPLWVRGGRG